MRADVANNKTKELDPMVVTVTVDDKKSINEWNEAVKVGEGMSQSCQAIFNIGTAIDPSLKKDPWGTIAVEIRWKGANCRLLEMPSTDASTTIKASVHPGCVQSQVSAFYQELQFLRQIISAVTTGEVTWAFATSDQPSVSMTTAVKNLIESLQETGSIRSAIQEEVEKQEEEYNLSTAVASMKVTARKDLDFTDKLWQVLTNCMSTAELVASLRLVFKALGQGHLRPFVDRYNQTTVARLVRGALSGCFFAPGLTGAEPFVLLAEMGAEKLRRDYIAIFVTHSLSTPSALEHLTDSDKELQPKLQDLDKLHNAVEMVTLLGSFLHLSQDSLSRVAQQMVNHYKQQPFTAHEVFSFPVKTSEVRCTLSSTQPAMWCAETTSKIAGFDNVFESSLYCLCANQPFFHLQGRSRAGVGGKGDNSRENGVGVEELSGLDDEKGQYCLVRRKESVMIV